MQPYFCVSPLALHSGHGNSHGGADLRDREPTKEAQLDDLALPRVELFQFAERFVHGDAQLEEAATKAGQDRQVQVTGDDPPGTWRMPVSLFLLQAINHGTEHRSQVATILTQLGIEPPDTDGWAYFFASGHMVEV